MASVDERSTHAGHLLIAAALVLGFFALGYTLGYDRGRDAEREAAVRAGAARWLPGERGRRRVEYFYAPPRGNGG